MSKGVNGFTPFFVRFNKNYNDKKQTNKIKNTFFVLPTDRLLFVARGKGEESPRGRGEESEAFGSVYDKIKLIPL